MNTNTNANTNTVSDETFVPSLSFTPSVNYNPSVTTSLKEAIEEQEKGREKEKGLMGKVNTLSKSLITIIKMVAALANKRESCPELDKYIHPQLELLTNLINIKKNPILDVLKSRFQEMLQTYIVYMDELVKDVLDYDKYYEMHYMLVLFNSMVKTSVKTNSLANLYDIIPSFILLRKSQGSQSCGLL